VRLITPDHSMITPDHSRCALLGWCLLAQQQNSAPCLFARCCGMACCKLSLLRIFESNEGAGRRCTISAGTQVRQRKQRGLGWEGWGGGGGGGGRGAHPQEVVLWADTHLAVDGRHVLQNAQPLYPRITCPFAIMFADGFKNKRRCRSEFPPSSPTTDCATLKQ